jgi:hypothetical protein
MNEELYGVAIGEPVTVNHIILNGSLVVLTDGRVLNVPATEARVTDVWPPSTCLEIWKDDPASPFPLCVRNTIKDEEVHGRWAPTLTPA